MFWFELQEEKFKYILSFLCVINNLHHPVISLTSIHSLCLNLAIPNISLLHFHITYFYYAVFVGALFSTLFVDY